MADKVALGCVTGELDGPRGPDVRSTITVPGAWLTRGGQLLVAVPRLAACEACRGGGCHTCNYRGAFTLAEAGTREPVLVQLPSRSSDTSSLVLRLPHQGPRREVENEAPGHWFLEVTPGAHFSPGVSCRVPVSDERLGAVWLVVFVCLLAALTCWAVL